MQKEKKRRNINVFMLIYNVCSPSPIHVHMDMEGQGGLVPIFIGGQLLSVNPYRGGWYMCQVSSCDYCGESIVGIG